jgi:hypothetical protein
MYVYVRGTLPQMHRKGLGLRLSNLWGIYVHIPSTRCFHALWPQHSPDVLLRAHEELIQVPNMQQKYHKYGVAVPEFR